MQATSKISFVHCHLYLFREYIFSVGSDDVKKHVRTGTFSCRGSDAGGDCDVLRIESNGNGDYNEASQYIYSYAA